MDPNPPRIFISYSRRDARPQAERLQSLLRANALTSWRDLQSMTAGEILPQVLRAIEAADHLCLILSPAALASDWVKRESTHARLHAKSVCLILADPTLTRADLPPWARRQQIFNLDNQEETNLLLETLRRPSQARRVPYMEGHLPEDFVPRPHEYAQLKSAILAASQTTIGLTTALRGAGGYGKTSLANYLCRDPDIRAEFTDGILRIDIGRERNDVTGSILELCEILAPNTKHPGFQSPDSAADYLAALIGEARILLVIDDVWREAQLRPFLRPGPHVVRLVTTRIREALPRDCTQIQIDEMRTAESFQVLAARLPGANDPANRGNLTALADRLGHWAQMLRIANAWLRKRTESAEPLPRAIERFDALLTKKGLTAFDPKDKQQRDKAISACLEPSLEELGNDLPRFCDLAVLPEDENVPLDVVADLWRETAGLDPDDAEELFLSFETLSLLQSLDLRARTLSLHDNALWYLRDRVGADCFRKTNDAMVAAIFSHCNGNWSKLPPTHRYGWRHQIRHLRVAGRGDVADSLLTDYVWIKAKLEAFNARSLFESYLTRCGSEDALLVGQAIALSVPTLATDTDELSRQVWGRLGDLTYPTIVSLVSTAKRDPKFRPSPRWTHLTPPGAEILRFVGHGRTVTSATFSADGRFIVTSSGDKTARIWDSESGQEVRVFCGHWKDVTSACFSPDGKNILTSSADATARIWFADTGLEAMILSGHRKQVNTACFSRDGRNVLTSSRDGTAIFWDVTTGSKILVLQGHQGGLISANFSPDETQFLTSALDGTARLWNSTTGNEVAKFESPRSRLESPTTRLKSASFSPDGSYIVTTAFDGTFHIWDTRSKERIDVFQEFKPRVTSACFSSDGKFVLVSCWDRSIRLLELNSFRETASLRGHDNIITGACFAADGRRVLSGSTDKTARLWDIEIGKRLISASPPGHARTVLSACFSFSGHEILTTSFDHTARISDAATGREVITFRGHDARVLCGSFSPNATQIGTGSSDGTARIWDAKNGAQIACFPAHKSDIRSICFSPSGTLVLTASSDRTARIWEIVTGRQMALLIGHSDWVNSATFSPNGQSVLTASHDRTIRTWTADSGHEVACRSLHRIVNAISFSPDGTLIAAASRDNSLSVWHERYFELKLKILGHSDWVTCVSFSKDGEIIASGSNDKTIRLWDACSGREITRVFLDAAVTAISLSTCAIVAADRLGRVHVFDAEEFLAVKAPAHA